MIFTYSHLAVLDVKPYVPQYDNPSLRRKDFQGEGEDSLQQQQEGEDGELRSPAWVGDPAADLEVSFTPRAERDLRGFAGPEEEGGGGEMAKLQDLKDWRELRRSIADILRADPRLGETDFFFAFDVYIFATVAVDAP